MSDFFDRCLLISSLFLLLTGCQEDPGIIGRDILPDSDGIAFRKDSAEMVSTMTVRADSIVSSHKDAQLLGDIHDPVFGYSKAEFITRYGNTGTTHSFGTNPKVDSVILTLYNYHYFGNDDALIRAGVYEFTGDLRGDTNYYSNFDVTGLYNQSGLGSVQFHPADTLVRIRIENQQYIDRILNAEDTLFRSYELFREEFRGLYITAEDPGQGGAVVYFNLSDPLSAMRIYYANDDHDSLSYEFGISANYPNLNLFSHDYRGTPVEPYLNDMPGNDSILFLQALGGVQAMIRLPEIDKWRDSADVAINRAELSVTPIFDNRFDIPSGARPEALSLFTLGEDGRLKYLYDYLLNPDGFGGKYNDAKNVYIFNVTYHLQHLIRNADTGSDFVLTVRSNASRQRTILEGGASLRDHPVRLKIVYSKL